MSWQIHVPRSWPALFHNLVRWNRLFPVLPGFHYMDRLLRRVRWKKQPDILRPRSKFQEFLPWFVQWCRWFFVQSTIPVAIWRILNHHHTKMEFYFQNITILEDYPDHIAWLLRHHKPCWGKEIKIKHWFKFLLKSIEIEQMGCNKFYLYSNWEISRNFSWNNDYIPWWNQCQTGGNHHQFFLNHPRSSDLACL